ncbi:hypothetical protein NQ314_006884 [Rhamnusium bicolor]|uniref:Uncharacterized protein n=1 Tax=Rhamnusium bicolor TaxID=1586634 RepID=A0AAV8YXM6_9CUCU|nr:hypothetical protein NQ314_006884 [Rhamnusium bicolor]
MMPSDGGGVEASARPMSISLSMNEYVLLFTCVLFILLCLKQLEELPATCSAVIQVSSEVDILLYEAGSELTAFSGSLIIVLHDEIGIDPSVRPISIWLSINEGVLFIWLDALCSSNDDSTKLIGTISW